LLKTDKQSHSTKLNQEFKYPQRQRAQKSNLQHLYLSCTSKIKQNNFNSCKKEGQVKKILKK